MFYTTTKAQVEQLFPDLLTIEPGKMRLYYTQPDGTKRMVDRCHGYFFSDKPWGLEQEYLTEGIDQEFVDDQDYLSLNIRNSIKAPDGWTFVSCDYAAEELRLGAINTKGKVFLDSFRHNKDPHLNTALMMFGEEAVHQNKKKYRSLAKGCNSIDAYYATEDGYKKLSETDHILDLNGNKQKFINVVEHRIGHRVTFSNGKSILVTDNHKFFDLSDNIYKVHYVGMKTKYINDLSTYFIDNQYDIVTITSIQDEEGYFNIMECETHYYIAEGFAQPNCNFALQYGGSWRAIQQEGMSDTDTQAIYDAYMTAQSDHFAVQNSQVRKTHETLTEYSFFGLPVRLHNYYNSDNYSMVSAGERLAKNHRIQGCLKYETKILTDLGYIPIGELYDHYQEKYYTTKVWTGHRWAEFVPVYKGKHIFHKLHFDNGQILECDGRHKIKVFTDDGYIWKEVPDLKPGDIVAKSIPPKERINYGINSEVYYKLKLTKVENMHEEIDTYTLAVNDELHQFDSEGIISKNTGADVLSISYIKLWNNIFNKIPGIEDLVRFQITVHDEIDFIVRNDVIDIIVPEIIRCMQTQMPDWEIPLTIGLSFGPTFGAQYEFLYDPKTFKVIGPDMSPVIVKPKEEKKEVEVKEVVEEELTLDF